MRAPQDPDYDPAGPYPDHLYLYTGDDSVAHAASRPLQWPPGRVGRTCELVLRSAAVACTFSELIRSHYSMLQAIGKLTLSFMAMPLTAGRLMLSP